MCAKRASCSSFRINADSLRMAFLSTPRGGCTMGGDTDAEAEAEAEADADASLASSAPEPTPAPAWFCICRRALDRSAAALPAAVTAPNCELSTPDVDCRSSPDPFFKDLTTRGMPVPPFPFPLPLPSPTAATPGCWGETRGRGGTDTPVPLLEVAT
mgnify:CR=1 FL=1